jgi:hypothetical protein
VHYGRMLKNMTTTRKSPSRIKFLSLKETTREVTRASPKKGSQDKLI